MNTHKQARVINSIKNVIPKIIRYVGELDLWWIIRQEILFHLDETEREMAINWFCTNKNLSDFDKKVIKEYEKLSGIKIKITSITTNKSNVNLTDEQVSEIKERIWNNENRLELSKEYDIGLTTLLKIEDKVIYSHVPDPDREKIILAQKGREGKKKRPKRGRPKKGFEKEKIEKRAEPRRKKLEKRDVKVFRKTKLSFDDVRNIKRKLLNGEKVPILAKHYGVSKTLIQFIKNGRRWSHVEPAPPGSI